MSLILYFDHLHASTALGSLSIGH